MGLSINCLMMGILPFSLLIGMNVSILRHLTASPDRREGAMRALLFSIVGAQLTCHAPRTGLNIFEMSKVTVNLEDRAALILEHQGLVRLPDLLGPALADRPLPPSP